MLAGSRSFAGRLGEVGGGWVGVRVFWGLFFGWCVTLGFVGGSLALCGYLACLFWSFLVILSGWIV